MPPSANDHEFSRGVKRGCEYYIYISMGLSNPFKYEVEYPTTLLCFYLSVDVLEILVESMICAFVAVTCKKVGFYRV